MEGNILLGDDLVRELVLDVVASEQMESVDDDVVWDIEKTVDVIIEHLRSTGKIVALANRSDWEVEEGIHLAAFDYFSSYEPVFVGN